MGRKYVVFWMPTIFHKELILKKTEVVNDTDDGFFEISDKSPYPYHAKFVFSLEKNAIIISSKVTTNEGEIMFDVPLTFEYNQQRRNGFMQFSFNENDIPDSCKESFKNNLTNAFYHKIKEFYHEHECNTGKDSDLQPLITNGAIALESDDNPALIGFLRDFSELLCKNAISVSFFNKQISNRLTDYKKLRPNLSHASDWQEFCELHDRVLIDINVLNELLENSLIEYTYCKTLLSSIYNKSFKHDISQISDNEKINENRRKALNIRNSIRYIENIKYKNQNRQFELLHISNKGIGEQSDLIKKTLHNDKK